MKSYFLEKEQSYRPAQLFSYWGQKKFQITGNYILSFIKKPFLFFITENFDSSLKEMIFNQHLLSSIIQENLDYLLLPPEETNSTSLIKSKILVQESSFFIILETNLDFLFSAQQLGLDSLIIEPKKIALNCMNIYKEKINMINSNYLELQKL
jgi:hypothetical protein